MAQAADAALRAVGFDADRQCLTLAGRTVVLEVAGSQLAAALAPAFAHLRQRPQGEPPGELRITVWDEKEVGVALADADLTALDGEHWEVRAGTLATTRDARHVVFRTPSSLYWLDRSERRIVGWVASTADLTLAERGKPFELLLAIWHHDRGVPILHAGCISVADRGALVVGRSGSGKSTTCLACLRHGFGYLGDDQVGLEEQPDGGWAAHSVYAAAWVEASHAQRFPHIVPTSAALHRRADDKLMVPLVDSSRDRIRRWAGIDVLLAPSIVPGGGGTLVPLSPGQMLLHLTPSVMLGSLPRPDRAMFDRLARLANAVPAFRLEIGEELTTIPTAVAHALDGLDQ